MVPSLILILIDMRVVAFQRPRIYFEDNISVIKYDKIVGQDIIYLLLNL